MNIRGRDLYNKSEGPKRNKEVSEEMHLYYLALNEGLRTGQVRPANRMRMSSGTN